jgi:two-component system, sensor histidine kinase and response regulator
MPRRYEFSLQHKVQGIVVASCAVALVVASVIFTVNDRETFLQAKREDLVASAKMIESISTATLTFRDVRSAQEILRVFEADPQVALACMYDGEGQVLSTYRRVGAETGNCPAAKAQDESAADAKKMTLYQRIFSDGETIGRIYLEADLADVHERLRRIVAVDAVTVIVSLWIAFLLSYRLHRVISVPIRELAQTASLSAREDYSIRAQKWSNDEIGVLCDQFNEMLERIQQRDLAVHRAHEELEQRVAERTSFLNALVENSPLAILVVDQERIVRFCNGAFEDLFQYAKPEILGKPVDVLLGIEEVLEVGSAALHSQRQVQAVSGAQRMRRDGTMIDVEIHDTPLSVNGEARGSLVLYQDISARKRVERAMQHAKEQAEAASRAKSEFLANMSHEIRTPMNGIMGMTDLVLDTELDAEQREYLNLAKSSADALLTLINDILDFSKIEAGKLEIDRIEFSLSDSLGETMKSLSLRAHQKGLELAYELEPDVPDLLVGDPGRLRQIIVNLVGNAVKFTEHGEVTVHVSLESRGAGEARLHFLIADTGIGIAEEKRSSIFEAFTQADGSMTRTYGGTGLGLTISSRLVAMMDGKIWVESELGRGSRFHFTAKFGAPETAWKKTAERDPRSLRDMNVLVVDDNETNRRILMRMLSGWSAKPVGVGSGAEAIQELREGQLLGRGFPLILLDAQMPLMDGFALVEEIKLNSQWDAPTIMMLSSAGQRGDARRCRELGVAAYLTKPVRTGELLEAILVALGNGSVGAPAALVAQKATSLVTRHSLRESHARLRILLVEDNPVNQRLAIRMLEKRGHVVTVAGNGEEALAALGRAEFDLAFMDVQMPVMDGLEATAAIRAREKIFGGHLRIVAMTAHAMVSDQERCLAAGMDDYLSKPLQRDVLDEMLRKVAARMPEVVSDEIKS